MVALFKVDVLLTTTAIFDLGHDDSYLSTVFGCIHNNLAAHGKRSGQHSHCRTTGCSVGLIHLPGEFRIGIIQVVLKLVEASRLCASIFLNESKCCIKTGHLHFQILDSVVLLRATRVVLLGLELQILFARCQPLLEEGSLVGFDLGPELSSTKGFLEHSNPRIGLHSLHFCLGLSLASRR